MRLLAVLVCLACTVLADKVPTPPNGYAYWGIHAGAPWYASDAQTEITNDEASVGRKFGALDLPVSLEFLLIRGIDVDRIYNIFNEQFPFDYHRWTASQGRIPFISLQPYVYNSSGGFVIPCALLQRLNVPYAACRERRHGRRMGYLSYYGGQ